jgi:hypothetical protein
MPRLVCLLLLAIPLPAHAAEPEWGTDLEAAKRRAKKEDKPIFVVFRCEH